MAERFIAPVLKTGDPQGSVGSNPTPSAILMFMPIELFIAFGRDSQTGLIGRLARSSTGRCFSFDRGCFGFLGASPRKHYEENRCE
jgi:hypothetical protein